MFELQKRFEISCSHFLNLPYESKCENIHGHNWIIEVKLQSEILDPYGMLIDFTQLKEIVMSLDHTQLNDIVPQPTAELIASCIAEKINTYISQHEFWGKPLPDSLALHVVSVLVQESEGNKVCYMP